VRERVRVSMCERVSVSVCVCERERGELERARESVPPSFENLSQSSSMLEFYQEECRLYDKYSSHPGVNPGANLQSTSHRCYLREAAFEWELTKEKPSICSWVVSRVVSHLGSVAYCYCGSIAAALPKFNYRGTSLIRNTSPVGPCSSPIPRDLWWS